MLGYLIKKLEAVREAEGSLLDHSLILYGSNMGNSNQHLHYDVPHVLVGGASVKVTGDRHLAFASRAARIQLDLELDADLHDLGTRNPEVGSRSLRVVMHDCEQPLTP
jgi:hypothetical protein